MQETVYHSVPEYITKALETNDTARDAWSSLTPIMRNEWICWIISPKQAKTRNEHLGRMIREVASGKKRPCCWIGCIHRTDKPISPSVKGILEKQKPRKS